MSAPVLQLQGCTVTDALDNVLIHDVSLSVGTHECVGIIGESGSGKTMTARAILGLLSKDLKLSARQMSLCSQDLLTMNEKQKRAVIGQEIGFVPQNTVAYLHPLIRIRNQIADGFVQAGRGTRQQGQAKAEQLLASVGIRDPKRVMNSYPGQLSGGMRQRVNIAMALMCDPQLIIADEPTTALDCIVQQQVTELFFQLHQQRNTAILMISHNLTMLKKYCDRIIVMYAGQIVEAASAQEIFDHPHHPYTRALISVIPRLDQDPNVPLTEIPGYVPEKNRGRTSCLFADRCAHCQPQCRQPLQFSDALPHFSRCILQEGGMAG